MSVHSDATAPVLIVEDEPDSGDMERALLAQIGIRAVVVRRIEEALAVLSHHQPLVMVVDLGLPDGCGYDLIAESRSRGFCGHTVIVTGMLRTIPYHHVTAATTLTKPLVPAHFQHVVQECLRLSARPQPVSSSPLAGAVPPEKITTIRIGNCELDLADGALVVRGERVPLTRLEERMLCSLAADLEAWVPPEILFPQVWHHAWDKRHGEKCHAVLSRLNRKLQSTEASVRVRTSSACGFKLDCRKSEARQP
jgi:DNA-binding response OmpR family regulator